MIIFLSALIILIICTILFFVIGSFEYEHYIKKLASIKTIEEIDLQIKKDVDAINSERFKGKMLENILDHMEMWEQVKNYKLTNKL
jgi:hypothetical protein